MLPVHTRPAVGTRASASSASSGGSTRGRDRRHVLPTMRCVRARTAHRHADLTTDHRASADADSAIEITTAGRDRDQDLRALGDRQRLLSGHEDHRGEIPAVYAAGVDPGRIGMKLRIERGRVTEDDVGRSDVASAPRGRAAVIARPRPDRRPIGCASSSPDPAARAARPGPSPRARPGLCSRAGSG